MVGIIRHEDGEIDHRYTVEREYCGSLGRRPVARFMGDWIGSSETEEGAWQLAADHMAKRRNVNPSMIPDGGVLFHVSQEADGHTFVHWDMTGVGSTAGHIRESDGEFTAWVDTRHPDLGTHPNRDKAVWAIIAQFAQNRVDQ